MSYGYGCQWEFVAMPRGRGCGIEAGRNWVSSWLVTELKWLRKLCLLHSVTFSSLQTEIPASPERCLPFYSCNHLLLIRLLPSLICLTLNCQVQSCQVLLGKQATHQLLAHFLPLPSLRVRCQHLDIALLIELLPICSDIIRLSSWMAKPIYCTSLWIPRA